MVNALYIFLYFILLLNQVESSHIFPIKKIILTNNIKNMCGDKTIVWTLESNGYGIKFNEESDISLIPYNLFEDIQKFYEADEQISLLVKKYENGTEEIIIDAYFDNENGETTHFILENLGISIPFKYFYIKTKIEQNYKLVFKSNKNQEYIEFGKDLLDVMNIEFKNEKNFVINNKEFVTIIDED